jgi:hypothetical protein
MLRKALRIMNLNAPTPAMLNIKDRELAHFASSTLPKRLTLQHCLPRPCANLGSLVIRVLIRFVPDVHPAPDAILSLAQDAVIVGYDLALLHALKLQIRSTRSRHLHAGITQHLQDRARVET